MRSCVLLVIVLILIAFSVACSPVSQTAQTVPPEPSPTVDQRFKRTSAEQYESTTKGIAGVVHQLRIPNLKEAKNHRGIEFRLYMGFGLFFPKCFIYRSVDNKREALLIDAKVRNNKAVFDRAGNIQPESRVLIAPVSGWESFERALSENGVGPTISLKFDEYDTVDPDEGSIVLELRNENNYSAVSYTRDNNLEDGRKAKRVCQLVEKEFGVTMSCN
jgi:hypothetical protein